MGLKNKITPADMAAMINPPNSMSLSNIGKKYDVSRQRVHQVLQEYRKAQPDLFLQPEKPTKKEIEQCLNQNNSLAGIAKKLSITTGCLKKYMEEYSLEKKFIKDVLTEALLKTLYVDKEEPNEKIAADYGCSPNTVMKLRYKYKIYDSMKKSLKDRLSKEIFIELYVNKELKLAQIADLFHTNIQNVIILKKEYTFNDFINSKRCGLEKRVKYRAAGVTGKELQSIKNNLILREVIQDETLKNMPCADNGKFGHNVSGL